MNPSCTQVRECMTDLHDGKCTPAEHAFLTTHIAGCADCKAHKAEFDQILDTLDSMPVEEPSEALRRNFTRMLETECEAEAEAARAQGRRGLKEGRSTRRARASLLPFTLPAWTQVAAAACLLLVGGLAGAGLARRDSPPAANIVETQRKLADLQTRLDDMTQVVAYSLSHQQPDGVRLQRVSTPVEQAGVDSTRLASLLGTLAFDPSTNVRLSALEALYPHANQIIVRDGVIASLRRERSPLVQVAMIDFLSSLGDPPAREALDALIRDQNTAESVREAARRALAVSL